MAPKPPPGTFRLYPYANPPLTAGKYTVSGEVTGLPGTVEPLQAAIDITAPRFTLPPDQVLSTFPPASARGAFTSRLPQIVVRRRTLPWERSEFAADGRRLSDLTPEQRRTTTPRPWLALVLIAEGEGSLLSDVPVADSTTAGTTLADPTDIDVPKTTCLELPESVVTAVFPALEDLPSLVHVREVDLNDTELALGDDDGWMAVVLCNRLPQANTSYTVCLINVEGQYDELPTDPPVAEEYDPTIRVVDMGQLELAVEGYAFSSDAEVMGTTTIHSLAFDDRLDETSEIEGVTGDAASAALASGPDLVGEARDLAPRTSKAAASTGSGWSTAVALPTAAGAAAVQSTKSAATADLGALGSGLTVYLPWHLVERTLRFPVLASWSFYCTDAGDFQYLAENVNSRLLGHIPTGPETPDGEPLPPGTTPPGLPAEPPSARPLPLVAATGHVATAHETRRGSETTAWFRGPLVPDPVDRPGPRPDGRYPLAHHADQLRRVSPDGLEDLSYAAGFEIGRLLALSRPGFVTALNQWRRQRFAAATTAALGEHLAAQAPGILGELFRLADPFVDRDWVTAELPGPPPPEDPRAAAGVGRRFVRGLLSAFGDEPTDLAPARPLADPGFAVDDPGAVFSKGRDARLTRGLALPDEIGLAARAARGRATSDVAERLWGAPVAAAPRDAEADLAAARASLEELAGRLADATERSRRRSRGRRRREES
jgi:hypothetical protein